MRRILLVEDEAGLALMLSDRLRGSHYEVEVAVTGPEALRRAGETSYDLILLDLRLPQVDGLEVCRRLREQGLGTPIIMLTALDGVADRVVGLRIGADDYLVKPFETIELLARIEALLRRSGPAPHGPLPFADPYRFGDIEVRFREAQVLRAGTPVHLTKQMFDLLQAFIRHRGTALTRDEILDRAWSPDAMPSARTVDVHVAWLRRLIEPNPRVPRYLLTVRGLGYRFVG